MADILDTFRHLFADPGFWGLVVIGTPIMVPVGAISWFVARSPEFGAWPTRIARGVLLLQAFLLSMISMWLVQMAGNDLARELGFAVPFAGSVFVIWRLGRNKHASKDQRTQRNRG